MKRRTFIAFVGTLAVWPLVVRAQQGSGERLIGMLSPISEAAAVPNVEAFRAGLRDLGYVEGRNFSLRLGMRTEPSSGSLNLLPNW
jgi:hypothetical protein